MEAGNLADLDKRLTVHEAVCIVRHEQNKDTLARIEAEQRASAVKMDTMITLMTRTQGAGWAFNKTATVLAGVITITIAAAALYLR